MGVNAAAKQFQRLLGYEYRFTVTLNRHTEPVEIRLRFSPEDFVHLCGLHKLKDISAFRNEDRAVVFEQICNGKYEDAEFCKSAFYTPQIADRIKLMENLEAFLDSEKLVFKFNAHNTHQYTQIVSDYILKVEDEKRSYFCIFQDHERNNEFHGCSSFKRSFSEKDFAVGHTRVYLLKTEKLELLAEGNTLTQNDDNSPTVSSEENQESEEGHKNEPFPLYYKARATDQEIAALEQAGITIQRCKKGKESDGKTAIRFDAAHKEQAKMILDGLCAAKQKR